MSFMPPADDVLEIRVLGVPSIHWRGREYLIKPPLALQALLAVALNQSHELTRSAIAQKLFSHLPPSSRGNQARLALRKLRRQLETADLDGIVEWSESNVRILPRTYTDIDDALSDSDLTIEHLSRFASPVLEGCSTKVADETRRLVKNWIEGQLPTVYATFESASQLRDFAQSLAALRPIYPQSALICAYLCAALRQLDFAEEFTREVVAFESDWLDTFGVADRPDIPSMVQAILDRSGSKSHTGPPVPPKVAPTRRGAEVEG